MPKWRRTSMRTRPSSGWPGAIVGPGSSSPIAALTYLSVVVAMSGAQRREAGVFADRLEVLVRADVLLDPVVVLDRLLEVRDRVVRPAEPRLHAGHVEEDERLRPLLEHRHERFEGAPEVLRPV